MLLYSLECSELLDDEGPCAYDEESDGLKCDSEYERSMDGSFLTVAAFS